jgi:DNA-binding transcriptional MerR regulator
MHYRPLVPPPWSEPTPTSGSEAVFGIGAVARMLGVSAAVLRAWEQRYGVVVPSRTGGNQRVYSREDVERLRYARDLIESGLNPAGAHRMLALRSHDGEATARGGRPDPGARRLVLVGEQDAFGAALVEALLTSRDYETLVTREASELEVLFNDRHPALVVIDCLISGGMGLRYCRTLHAAGATVLALSSLDLHDAALEAGADAFVPKPIDPVQFLSTIFDVLGSSGEVLHAGSVAIR